MWAPGGRHQPARPVRGAHQGHHQRDHRQRGRDPAVHRRAAHDDGRGRWRRPHERRGPVEARARAWSDQPARHHHPDEYREHIEMDAALERRFQPIQVDQPTTEECISILRGIKKTTRSTTTSRSHDDALIAATKMTSRYIPDRALPDKAIDAIDEAASRLRIEMDSKPTELDHIERRIFNLESEHQTLLNEDSAKTPWPRASASSSTWPRFRSRPRRCTRVGAARSTLLDKLTQQKEEYDAARARCEATRKESSGAPPRSNTPCSPKSRQASTPPERIRTR